MLRVLVIFLVVFLTVQVFADSSIELIKNGNFESGLEHWIAKIYEFPNNSELSKSDYFVCSPDIFSITCRASQLDYPQFGVSDDRSPGDRYFYAYVPAFVWGSRTAVSLEQVVDIPESDKVTLSFDVQGFSQTLMQIYIKEKWSDRWILLNQLNISTERYKWGEMIHREYDLSEYSGKSVIIQFVPSEIVHPNDIHNEVESTGVYFYNISLVAIPTVIPEIIPTTNTPTDDNSIVAPILIIVGAIVAVSIIIKFKKPKKTYENKIKPITETKLQTTNIEEPFLETGRPVSDELQIPKEELNETKIDDTYSDNDYVHAISMDAHMKCLWALLKAPNHSFLNKQELIEEAQGHDGDRRGYYKVINDLIDSGLVCILDKRIYADKIRTTGRPELTKTGIELAQIARDKKIVQWKDFVEIFKDRLAHSKR